MRFNLTERKVEQAFFEAGKELMKLRDGVLQERSLIADCTDQLIKLLRSIAAFTLGVGIRTASLSAEAIALVIIR